jgi:acyl-CoA synthetase (AMP-forming)/AMP-acid ligase II
MRPEERSTIDLPVPLPRGEKTITDVLERVARDHPHVQAYLDGERRITYLELAARSSGLATRLRGLGVGPGDVVALRLPSCIEYALTYLAAARLGAVTTGLNPRLGRRELEGILSRARPVAMVLEDDVDLDILGAPNLPVLRRVEVAEASPSDPGWRPFDLEASDPVAIV